MRLYSDTFAKNLIARHTSSHLSKHVCMVLTLAVLSSLANSASATAEIDTNSMHNVRKELRKDVRKASYQPFFTAQSNTLSLQATIVQAQKHDQWLVKSKLLESRLQGLSEGAGTLPDPTFSFGLLNLPTNGFAIDQEPMTQLKIGASQMFPRGDSLALQEKRYELSATEQPFLRDNRRRQVALEATQLWLDAYKASVSHRLIQESRPLFDKLGDIVAASYASSSGKARQQDIIRAELELVRLNDRLITLESQKNIGLSKLSQYLFNTGNYSKNIDLQAIKLPESLPELTKKQSRQLQNIRQLSPEQFHTVILQHPLLAASEQRMRASAVDIDIAKQGFKPQYGISTSYALRDDAPTGQSRADFFSIGLTINVPIFSSSRQDANVSSATFMTQAIRTEKILIMRELIAGLNSALAAYEGASSRLSIYEQQILPQMTQQAQAALNAYTNDTGDFAEVVRAKIDELDAKLTLLSISVNQRSALANMHYFYSPAKHDLSINTKGDDIYE